MRKYFLLLLFVFQVSFSYAQFPEIDHQFKEKMIKAKMKYFSKIISSQDQPTANQEKYDVKYYSLDLSPDIYSEILYGQVKIVGEVIAPTLDFIELNFMDNMTVTKVHKPDSSEKTLTYTHNNNILSVDLGRNFSVNEQFGFVVVYHGQPYPSFSFGEHNGSPMIGTSGEPYGSRDWWPCKDFPSDKADSVDIRVTIPSNLIVASNGTLREKKINGDETSYWWHEKYPIVTYLVSVAIHPYTVFYEDYIYNDNSDTMKIHFYVFPDNYDKNMGINRKVKDMLTFFSDRFGEYPFIDEKYGHADFLSGGAMEHQTCSSFAFWNEWVYAHELAHQWWGDLVTCRDFHHIWLNEGFAEYSEALWYEHLYGPGAASYYQMRNELYYGPGTIYVEDLYESVIFNYGRSYQKASWVLHMLRHVVGDDLFFDILKTYAASLKHSYGTATTEEFRDVCEQVSGKNLQKFFHQWIYEEYYPHYSYSWQSDQNGSNYDIRLEIKQLQDNYIFWMPIDVSVSTVDGDTTFVVLDSLQTQNFQLSVSSRPLDIKLDKGNWILKKVEESFENSSFDRGILLVNGVSFTTYGAEITEAYQKNAFWGDFPITFWDCFSPPSGGYPANLPAPSGHGSVPGDFLGQFSTVIWVGNNYQGDLVFWQNSSILPYLQAGGNVLLLSRLGQSFITSEMRQYLGINWAEEIANTISNCIAEYPGLSSIPLTGLQSINAVFDTALTSSESQLLFTETSSFTVPRGLGVWRKPAAGGTYRSYGGQFVFISGRPYRYDPDVLSSNVEFILDNFFHEVKTDVGGRVENILIKHYQLEQNYPNPFNSTSIIQYQIPSSENVSLIVYNLLGQKIKTLINETKQAGKYQVIWDGKDDFGFDVPSGVYLYILDMENYKNRKKIVILR